MLQNRMYGAPPANPANITTFNEWYLLFTAHGATIPTNTPTPNKYMWLWNWWRQSLGAALDPSYLNDDGSINTATPLQPYMTNILGFFNTSQFWINWSSWPRSDTDTIIWPPRDENRTPPMPNYKTQTVASYITRTYEWWDNHPLLTPPTLDQTITAWNTQYNIPPVDTRNATAPFWGGAGILQPDFTGQTVDLWVLGQYMHLPNPHAQTPTVASLVLIWNNQVPAPPTPAIPPTKTPRPKRPPIHNPWPPSVDPPTWQVLSSYALGGYIDQNWPDYWLPNYQDRIGWLGVPPYNSWQGIPVPGTTGGKCKVVMETSFILFRGNPPAQSAKPIYWGEPCHRICEYTASKIINNYMQTWTHHMACNPGLDVRDGYQGQSPQVTSLDPQGLRPTWNPTAADTVIIPALGSEPFSVVFVEIRNIATPKAYKRVYLDRQAPWNWPLESTPTQVETGP